MMRLAIGMSASVRERGWGVLGVAISIRPLCAQQSFLFTTMDTAISTNPPLTLPRRGGEKRGGRRVLRGDIHLLVHRIADDRASHAVTATATATQFSAHDRDDLDTLLAQQCVRVGVPVIGEDHTR